MINVKINDQCKNDQCKNEKPCKNFVYQSFRYDFGLSSTSLLKLLQHRNPLSHTSAAEATLAHCLPCLFLFETRSGPTTLILSR